MQERPGEPASAMLIKCAPDRDGCIDLGSIMSIMSQIDQEQAWALAYQLAALMQRLWPAGNNCATIESLGQIYINQEGWVHEKSLQLAAGRSRRPRSETSSPTTTDDDDESSAMQSADESLPQQAAACRSGTATAATLAPAQPDSHSNCNSNNNNNSSSSSNNSQQRTECLTTQLATSVHQKQTLPPTPPITPELEGQLQRRQRAATEQELVSSLGVALFRALDYGIPDDEERALSPEMEFLIVQSQKGLTLAELEEICLERLPMPSRLAAEQHYRETCKALVADTIELSILLEKIYTATMVMNGAGPAAVVAAAHGLQKPASLSPAPAPLPTSQTNNNDTSDMMSHYRANNYLHLAERQATQADYLKHHLLHTIDQDELSELGLPLASLRALKINEWARLWMQVIRELRQKRHFQQHQQRHQYENEHAPNDVLQAV